MAEDLQQGTLGTAVSKRLNASAVMPCPPSEVPVKRKRATNCTEKVTSRRKSSVFSGIDLVLIPSPKKKKAIEQKLSLASRKLRKKPRYPSEEELRAFL